MSIYPSFWSQSRYLDISSQSRYTGMEKGRCIVSYFSGHRCLVWWSRYHFSYLLRVVNQPWKRSSNPEFSQSRFFSVLHCDEKIRNLFEGFNGTFLESNYISLSCQGWTSGITDHHTLRIRVCKPTSASLSSGQDFQVCFLTPCTSFTSFLKTFVPKRDL